MVQTRSQMEARLEFLERAYEDYRATSDEVKNLRQQLEVQQAEAQRRVEELSEIVNGLSIRCEKGPPQQIHNLEDKWRKLTIPIFLRRRCFWLDKSCGALL